MSRCPSPLLSALLGFATCALACAAWAEGSESKGPIRFNRDIRPILADRCFACHGPDAAARKADLRLDEREAAIDYGAIAPGDAEASLLLERMASDDPDLVMPPPSSKKPKLSGDEIDLLRR